MGIRERLKSWWENKYPEIERDDEGRILVGEPEHFLSAILATEPVAHLVDSRGRLIDAEGEGITSKGRLDEVHPPGIQRLIAESMEVTSVEELLPRTSE